METPQARRVCKRKGGVQAMSRRNYCLVEGLEIPFVLETRVLHIVKTATGLGDLPVPPERINIEKVVRNPKFEEELFSKPDVAVSARVQ